jgi:DNA-binding CsgD family transcriptional regulator
MTKAATRRHAATLIERCYAGLDATSLRVETLARLRSLMSIDAAFFATVDPITMLFTSAVSEDPLIPATPRFLDNEYGPADVNRFADLALTAEPIASLDHATHGDRGASRRFTEIMAPLGLGDELRIVLRAGGRSWGVMCLHRAAAATGFDEHDIALLRRLAPHLAEGLRCAQLRPSPTTAPTSPSTGIIVLDHELQLVSINPAAERWLAEITDVDWPTSAELPLAVYTAARRVGQIGENDDPTRPPPQLRLRTRTGRWVLIHASHLHGSGRPMIAVVLEAASTAHLESVLLATHGLTPAQERVAALVLRGRSTRQITDALHISANTVQEHLKAVFDKFGVHSRRELVAAVMTRR